MTVTQTPTVRTNLTSIDLTPDAGLAVRILSAYADNCCIKWDVEGLNAEVTGVYDQMNADQDRRAEILRVAIALLG